ncbi:hypothetical protein Acr_00g0055140 [Actinidia rufa]|uniref:Uncharacterized protein n=1 Tax=Actinidia rufa TaxID=165716 RepID=A0A7J0DLU6_9ERIC|nr:hypothetical protein Acr_00g0055140 [Actinidia rufa]
MELNRSQLLPDAEGVDGALPPHRHVGVCQLCPNCAHNGHFDAPETFLQCRRSAARLYRAVVEEGAEHTLPERFVWVLSKWEFRAMDDGLWSILRHHGRLLDNFNDLFKRQSKEYKKVFQAVNNRQALRKHAFSIAELSKQVMVADSIKNHDTILALAQEVMLPKDVADLGATPPVVEPVDPSQAYSPLVLPSFNEEELLEEGADEVPEEAPEVACELSKEAAKAAEDSVVAVEENSVAAEGASPTCPLNL